MHRSHNQMLVPGASWYICRAIFRHPNVSHFLIMMDALGACESIDLNFPPHGRRSC